MPLLDEDKPAEITKRDKRRAKESRRKAEEEAQQLVLKDQRKAGRKAKQDTTAQQEEKLQKAGGFVMPKKKGKARVAAVPEDAFTEEKATKAVDFITLHREKMVDRWGEGWTRECRQFYKDCAYCYRLLARHTSDILSIGDE